MNSNSDVRISEDVAYEVLDGEAILLQFDSGVYFELNETGTRILQLIEEYGDLARVREEMRTEFDVDPTILEADLASLVEELNAKGLVELVER